MLLEYLIHPIHHHGQIIPTYHSSCDSSDSPPILAKGFWLGEIISNQTINRLTGGVPSWDPYLLLPFCESNHHRIHQMFVWHSLNYFDPKQEYKLKQQSWTKLIEMPTSWSDPIIPPGHDPNLQRSQTINQVSRQNIHRSIHHGTAEAQATQNLPHSSLQYMRVFWVVIPRKQFQLGLSSCPGCQSVTTRNMIFLGSGIPT